MPLSSSQKKGNDLEEAVRLIESIILGTNPATKEAVITIEPKKIVVVDEVKHEIDIYITIDYGKGYLAVFIFECKNWEKKVGKNEMLIFSKKIDIVQAQRGYFIAKNFSRDAVAQARQDKRMELLSATEALDTLPPFIQTFHIMHNTVVDSNILFRMVADDTQKVRIPTLTKESIVRYNNEDMLLGSFSDQILQRIVEGVMNHQPTASFEEGVYPYEKTQTIFLQPNELVIEGQEYQALDAQVKWETVIIRPPIVSKFDIQTRGRVITFDSGRLPTGESLQVSFVAVNP